MAKKTVDLYNLIAGRLVWDSDFFTLLMNNRDLAFADVLSKAGVKPTKKLLNKLDEELQEFIDDYGQDKILEASKSYLLQGTKARMV